VRAIWRSCNSVWFDFDTGTASGLRAARYRTDYPAHRPRSRSVGRRRRRPGHLVVLTRVVDRSDAVRPRITTAVPVVDHRIVGPAVPQRLDHAHELLAARIAVCVAYLARTAEVARCRGKPRRHDVPAHATVADVVQRSELACEIERLGIGGRRRGNHSDPAGRHRHRREHGDGLKPGTRRLVHIIAQRELVGQEDRIEQACFCPLR
jgi:hypothetical protein